MKDVLVIAPEPLTILLRVISIPDVNCIDVDAVMDQVIEAVYEYQTADYELLQLPHTLIRYGYLGSGPGQSNYTHSNKYMAKLAVHAGYALKTHLKQLKLFEGDFLQYEHSKVINDRSIELRARRRYA